MVSFTAALDALVTANLVDNAPIFESVTLGVDSRMVTSDLGLSISTDDTIDSLTIKHRENMEILIVCGGFRCSLTPLPTLTTYLKAADKLGMTLGGLWNGAVALAYAGLLEQQECAAHPDNHAFLHERFPLLQVSSNTLVISENRATCSGPNSALEMMLQLIRHIKGDKIVRAIREILSCDQTSENRGAVPLQLGDNPTLPATLKEIIALMRNNIEDPLSLEELAGLNNISRRQMERQFQIHIDKTPSRFYLELRMNHARRLLLQTNETITNIALASGFVSTSHFSNCFKDFFGMAPTTVRQKSSS